MVVSQEVAVGSSRMAEEIAEGPEAVARTLEALAGHRGAIAARIAESRLVVFFAHGTSDHASLYGQYLLSTRAGIPAFRMALAVAEEYRPRLDLSGAVAIGLSQSGRTEDVVEALDWARRNGARTIAITNEPASRLADAADLAVVTDAGPERAIPATKTFLAQLAALATLTAAVAHDLELDAGLAELPAALQAALVAAKPVEVYVDSVLTADQTVVVGNAYAHPAALETALKLQETAYLPVHGFAAREFLHGPVAVLDERVATIVLGTSSPDGGEELKGLTALARGRGGRVLAIGEWVTDAWPEDNRAAGNGVVAHPANLDIHLPVGPGLPAPLHPLVLTVPGQILAERVARRLGLDPDRPRGLAKVTGALG
jgi:glucosamine--fructose-6-phosphate aminotransferase (isomerizing)